MTLETELTTEPRGAPSPTRRRVLGRRALRVAWFVVLVAGLILALHTRWAEVRHELANLEAWRLLIAMGIGIAGVGASSGIWHAMLTGIGEALPVPVSLRIFFVGQIGKYLPGAVWPAVTQAALAREHGVAPRATVAAVTLFLWVHLVTGTALAVAVLAVTGRLPVVALFALPVLVLLLTPKVLGWALQFALRTVRRRPLRHLPDGRHLLVGSGWALIMWMCYGAHLQVLTSAVGDPVGLVLASGVFAAGWVVGFVLLIAPAGVGPREGAIVALLPLTAAAGLLVALVSRLILTVADAFWAGLTAADLERLGRAVRERSAQSG